MSDELPDVVEGAEHPLDVLRDICIRRGYEVIEESFRVAKERYDEGPPRQVCIVTDGYPLSRLVEEIRRDLPLSGGRLDDIEARLSRVEALVQGAQRRESGLSGGSR